MTPEGSHVYSIFAARGKIGIMGQLSRQGHGGTMWKWFRQGHNG